MNNSPLRVGILAGEASGDLLGAGLMQALRDSNPDVQFMGIGGQAMTAAGLASQVPMERLSVMGLVEPLMRLPELLRIRRRIRDSLLDWQPDVFIGIDSPDFNLGLELDLKRAGIPVVHYVSPSVWAWRQGRIHKIKRAVDRMLTLFPFETAIYRQHGIPVTCVGHPLADVLPLACDKAAARQSLQVPDNARVLAVLPGSRGGEVARLAPAFFDTVRQAMAHWPDLVVLVPCANTDRQAQLADLLAGDTIPAVTLVAGKSHDVMAAADCVLMASGTATLEAMLLKKPMVVAYRMAPLSYAIISRLLKTPYVALPNLLAGRMIVPELLQDEVTPEALFREVAILLEDDSSRDTVIRTWQQIHEDLRRGANATAAAAVMSVCRG